MYKIVILFFISIIGVFGFDDFEYDIDISKSDIVVKEGVLITVLLKQKVRDKVVHFDFSFLPSDEYEIDLLESDESSDKFGRTTIKSKYLCYALKSGKIDIKPKLIIKKTSKEELKKFVTGSADELMYLQTKNRVVELQPMSIDVKDLEKDVDLVGDFKLKYQIDKRKINNNEQVNIRYILSGEGYKPEFKTLIKNYPDVDMFLDREFFDRKSFHKYTYLYAFSSDKNFTINSISLICYNPNLNKRYILKAPSFDIVVKNDIIKDHSSVKKDSSISYEKYINLFLLLIAGFFTQKLLKKLPKKAKSNDEIFIDKVKKAKTPKELLKYLISKDSIRYKTEIEKLELLIYHDSKIKLSTIKSSVIKSFLVVSEDSI